jgi:hypothetical protein
VATKFEFLVTMGNGQTKEVTAGQRELADWEREPFGCAGTHGYAKSPITFVRYLAYAALRRQRRLQMDQNGQPPSFEAWSEMVEDVEDKPDPEPETSDGLDPTAPDGPTEA